MEAHYVSIPMGEVKGVIIRMRSGDKVTVHLCFSQVSVCSVVKNSALVEGISATAGMQLLQKCLEENGIPDFDVTDEMVLEGFPAMLLSTSLGYMLPSFEKESDLGKLYKNFQETFMGCQVIPKESKTSKTLVDRSITYAAFVAAPNPTRVGIFYSKQDIMQLHRACPEVGPAHEIRRSLLPDRSLEPVEWIEGKHAELVAFLLWNHSIVAG